MELEGGKINNLQLTFLIIGFTFGSSVIISPGKGAGQDTWLAILAGLAEGLIFAWIFFTLAAKFPRKNIIQINEAIFGSFVGKVISLLYLWYFLHLGSLVLRNFGDFFTGAIYFQTPLIVIIGLTALLAASAVRNGIEVIARCSLLLVPITMFAFIFDTVFLLPQIEITKLLPILELPLKDFLKSSHSAATFPFGETVAFLMITSSLNKNSISSMKRFALAGIIIAASFFVMAAIRNLAVLGGTAKISLYPSYVAIQLIEVADIISRLEVAVSFAIFIMGFLKISVLYYGAVLGTAQILGLRSYLPLVLPIGTIMVVLSIIQFTSAVENITWATEIYPFYSLPFQLVFPLVALILAIIKQNKAGTKKAGEAQ
ncbi:MAG: hypothetical protein JM58_12195 [Peptococcaceae bacterium BICA1-8]|nr:MAG: hypothetical protein JM58_12195 [Peptococcaceae bacterium BICA1-8]